MRDLILKLLPEISVLRVPGVLKDENAIKSSVYKKDQAGTPSQSTGVPCVLDDGRGTPETPDAKEGVP